MSEKQESCPKCKETVSVIRIIYGRPGPQAQKDAEEGKVKLGGCSMGVERNYCKKCEVKF